MARRTQVILCVLIMSALQTSGVIANAEDFKLGAYAGLNSTEFSSSTASYDREMGLDAGAQVFYPLSNGFSFRTGAGIAQKTSSSKAGAIAVTSKFMYLEIPATAYYQMNDLVGLFGGLNFDLKMAESCSRTGGSCTVSGAKGFVVNLSLGGRFAISGPHFVEVPLDIGLTDMAETGATTVKLGNSLAVRYAYQF